MFHGYYEGCAAWIACDRKIALLIMEDVARFIPAGGGLPNSDPLVGRPIVDWNLNGVLAVESNWKNGPQVIDCLHLLGYTFPATRAK